MFPPEHEVIEGLLPQRIPRGSAINPQRIPKGFPKDPQLRIRKRMALASQQIPHLLTGAGPFVVRSVFENLTSLSIAYIQGTAVFPYIRCRGALCLVFHFSRCFSRNKPMVGITCSLCILALFLRLLLLLLPVRH